MALLRILVEIPNHPFLPGDVVDADLVDHPEARVREGSAQWSKADGSPTDPPFTGADEVGTPQRTALRAEPRETTLGFGGEETTARGLQGPQGLSTDPPAEPKRRTRKAPAKDAKGKADNAKDGG